jgi:hypothetical protein
MRPGCKALALVTGALLLCAPPSLAQSSRVKQSTRNRLISFEEGGLHGYADATGRLIFDGKYQHDGAGELLHIGDITSVPALLRVLKDNAPKGCAGERCFYVCTYAHAVAALQRITGHKAVAYDDWAAWWDEHRKSHPLK